MVGTPTGLGRGRYRVLATCPGDNCSPPVEDVPVDSCPDEIEDDLLECIGDAQEGLLVDREAAMSICFDEIDVIDMFEGLCHEDAFTTAPDWCAKGEEAFSEGFLPTCTDKIAADIVHEVEDIGLKKLQFNTAMDELQDAAWDACDDFCNLTLHAFTYEQDDVSIITLVDAVRSVVEFESASWNNRGEAKVSEVAGIGEDLELGDVLAPAKELAGSDEIEVGLGTYFDTPWPSVDASGSVYVVNFEDTKTVVVYDYVWFSE